MSKFFNALAVAVLGMALLMGAASADPSDDTKTTAITSQYSEYITVTAPGPVTTWSLSFGDNEYKSSNVYPTATLDSNYGGSVGLKVNDARTGFSDPLAAGHMTEVSGADQSTATKQFVNAMKVQANPSTSGTQVTLSGSPAKIYQMTGPNKNTIDIGFSQSLGSSDAAAANMYMIVTFTGTITGL